MNKPQTLPASDLIAQCGSFSLTWRWFGFENTDVAQKTPICKLCQKAVAVKDSSSTNLFHHLQINHSTEYEEYEKLRQSAVDHNRPARYRQENTASFGKGVPYNKKGNRWQGITKSVTTLCAVFDT